MLELEAMHHCAKITSIALGKYHVHCKHPAICCSSGPGSSRNEVPAGCLPPVSMTVWTLRTPVDREKGRHRVSTASLVTYQIKDWCW
jgi:hypothetical protein